MMGVMVYSMQLYCALSMVPPFQPYPGKGDLLYVHSELLLVSNILVGF